MSKTFEEKIENLLHDYVMKIDGCTRRGAEKDVERAFVLIKRIVQLHEEDKKAAVASARSVP